MIKKTISILCVMLILFALIYNLVFLKTQKMLCQLQVNVVDTKNNPINADVVILFNSNTVFKTKENTIRTSAYKGKTEPAVFNVYQKSSHAYVTIVVFAENYVDTILYNCVLSNEVMRSVKIILFQKSPVMPEVIAFSENPPENLSLELINRLK